MNAKSMVIIISITTLLLIAAVTFQVLEMCDYKLFETMFK